MLKIENITELNDTICSGFKLSYCAFLPNGSHLQPDAHYQIQFNKRPPFGNAQPACLTIGVDSDSRGRYHCKLYYATTNNVIWEEWLPKSTIAQRDALLRSIASMLHTHINRL